MLWLIAALAWGVTRILLDRSGTPPDEDIWGFGQVLAMSLTMIPLLSIFEALHGKIPTSTPLLQIQPISCTYL